MSNWNWLDFFVFLIFFVNTILGMSRGATKEIVAMMCLSAALIFTIKFTVPLAAFFNSSPLMNDMIDNQMTINFMLAIGAGPLTSKLLIETFYCISMLICFVSIFGVASAVFYYSGFSEAFPFPYATLNRKVGGGLGFIRGYVIVLLFLLILSHIFNKENNSAMDDRFLTGSFFYKLFQSTIKTVDQIIIEQNPERYREIYKNKNLYTPEEMFKNVNENVPPQQQLQPQPQQQPSPQPQ